MKIKSTNITITRGSSGPLVAAAPEILETLPDQIAPPYSKADTDVVMRMKEHMAELNMKYPRERWRRL